MVSVEVAVPPVGTVTGVGKLKLTPPGADPTQAVARLTWPLNPFMDEMVTVEYFVPSGVRLIVLGVGWKPKSAAAPLVIRVPLPDTITCSVAECDIAPLDAVT